MVVELKKDKASDVAVGQTLRYMGWIKENLASEQGEVEGYGYTIEVIDDGAGDIVPEPSTLVMLLSALGWLTVFGWRRRRA